MLLPTPSITLDDVCSDSELNALCAWAFEVGKHIGELERDRDWLEWLTEQEYKRGYEQGLSDNY